MSSGGNGTARYTTGSARPAARRSSDAAPTGKPSRVREMPSRLREFLTQPGARTSGLVIMSSGILLAACSLLPWLDGATGVHLMASGRFGDSGNLFFSLMNGMLYLSGIWALALGAAAFTGGLLRASGRESGATLALAAGILAALVALLNIFMALTRGAVYRSTPGAGVLLMLALSGVIITEVLIARLPEDYMLEGRQAGGSTRRGSPSMGRTG